MFALQQNLELYDMCQRQMATCDRTIEAHVQTLTAEAAPAPTALPASPRPPKRRANEPAFDIRTSLHQLTGGVDLTQIDGIAPDTALKLVSEIDRYDTLAHGQALYVVAHPGPEEQDLGWQITELTHRTLGKPGRDHAADVGLHPESLANGAQRARTLRHLRHRAATLGFDLVNRGTGEVLITGGS